MLNARKFDDRITVGAVPSTEDLGQLKELGYRTLVDVRDRDEEFGGYVRKKAARLGFMYIHIPVSWDGVCLEDLVEFYNVVFDKNSAPVYAFSRFGKKPLGFLLIFDAAAKGRTAVRVFKEASRFGIRPEGDEKLKDFIIRFVNSRDIESIVSKVSELPVPKSRYSALHA